MPAAARVLDPIGHTPALLGLAAGAILGAALAVAVVGTGGAALILVAAVGAGVAAGGGLGQVLGSMLPTMTTGEVISGARNVYVNGRLVAVALIGQATCFLDGPKPLAEGSATVLVHGQPFGRVGDKHVCSAVIESGSSNVFVGGPTFAALPIEPEVPDWVNYTLAGIGLASAIVLAGPIVAIGGFVLGALGGEGGAWVGRQIGGEGSNWEKGGMLLGSVVGGILGAKGGMGLAGLLKPTTATGGFIKGGLPGAKAAAPQTKPIRPVEDIVATPGEPVIPGKYDTKRMSARYVGEDKPGGSFNGGQVKYLSDAELAQHRLSFKDGKILDADGKPFDTTGATTWRKNPRAIWVMDKDGNFFASLEDSPGYFHHSSLGRGKPVAAAGELEVKNGVIVAISDESGHYMPNRHYSEQAIRELADNGIVVKPSQQEFRY